MKLKTLQKTPGILPKNYGSKALARLWPGFVGQEKRLLTEGPFLLGILGRGNGKNVFDASLGTGETSIFLIQNGYDVLSNEIDRQFRKTAKKQAGKSGILLDISRYDWRALAKKMPEGAFDAVLMLGNSLTYLFNKEDRRRAIEGVWHILKPGGIAIIDERNYPYILENRDKIMRGDFRYSGKYVYCGDEVHGRPAEIKDDLVIFEYKRQDGKGKPGYLHLYPFKSGELAGELQVAFSSIKMYSDFNEGYSPQADFFQYVCKK